MADSREGLFFSFDWPVASGSRVRLASKRAGGIYSQTGGGTNRISLNLIELPIIKCGGNTKVLRICCGVGTYFIGMQGKRKICTRSAGIKRAPSLELCALRTLGLEDFFTVAVGFSFCFNFVRVYISLRGEGPEKRENDNKIVGGR